jgi:hypothetical protein
VTIHVLVEGPSEQALLERWAPRLLGSGEVRVHPHQGKGTLPEDLEARPDARHRGLLDQLPAKLRGFANALHSKDHHVVVLVDADDDDPATLADGISAAAARIAPDLSVTVRLAVEETEAFYLGDQKALWKAFPGADMAKARSYTPDSIIGTWELFGSIVDDGGGNKVAWAEAMGPVLTTVASQNRSPSFQRLVAGLLGLAPTKPAKPAKRRYRHPPKKTHKPDRRR